MTAALPATTLAAAAIRLANAGAWDAAYGLVGVADCTDPLDRAALMLAHAEIAVADDQFRGGSRAPVAFESAGPVLAVAGDASLDWEFAVLRLRHEYLAAVLPSPGVERMLGPDGRDPEWVDALAERADRLAGDAPAGARIGLVCFFRGLIADNLAGDAVTARAWYERALADGGGDPFSDWEALRHLGGHDREAGDLDGARARWERAAELCASIGFVPGVLAQQLLLADLAAQTGDTATAATLAHEVARWAGAIGAERYRRAAAARL